MNFKWLKRYMPPQPLWPRRADPAGADRDNATGCLGCVCPAVLRGGDGADDHQRSARVGVSAAPDQ